MSADPDRALLAASLAFAGAAVLGSAVAIREDLPGQPCGISIPLSVPAGLLVGWGAGVAAPWPMPAAAVIAAARSQRTQPHALTGAVCAGIGICCVLGTVIEPVTRRPRSSSPATRLAIASNIAASAALTVTGLRHRAAAKALRLRDQANQQCPDRVICVAPRSWTSSSAEPKPPHQPLELAEDLRELLSYAEILEDWLLHAPSDILNELARFAYHGHFHPYSAAW